MSNGAISDPANYGSVQMKQTVNTNKQTVEAEIDENIFPREVITAAAYV